MIKEAYVSFEVAKLLKEKGFNELCGRYYSSQFNEMRTVGDICMMSWNSISDEYEYISIPTHQMAMAWLREIYHLEINITFGFPFIDGKQQYKYFWSIVRVCDNHLEYPMDDPNSAYYNEEMADSYEDAVEAALKYCLEKIIK